MSSASHVAVERLCQQPPEETITAEHLERCGYCLLCTSHLYPTTGFVDWPRPTYALRYIAAAWAEIEWLAYLPIEERRWYVQHSERLRRTFPNVPEEAWDKLFR